MRAVQLTAFGNPVDGLEYVDIPEPDAPGPNQVLIGVPEGGTFFCPHCGAMYSVTLSRLPKTDRNIANCVVCGQTMDERDSSKVPVYKLIHRPEDA